MDRIGPSTGIPRDMLRPDILLCLGEEEDEFEAALDEAGLDQAPLRTHHRAFHARIRDGILCLDGAVGSAVVEKCMWELLGTGVPERIVLVGTAGAMPGFRGDGMRAYRMAPASSVYQNFDAHPGATWDPTLDVGLPDQAIVSSDRFFGFSPLAEGVYPAEPGLQEAWARHCDRDLMVDMEVAAFYHYAQTFASDVSYAAIKAVANPVEDLDLLPETSGEALRLTVAAAVDALR